MIRSVAVYGGLLAVSLGVAWMRWTAEPEPDLEGQIVLLQGDGEDIEKIVWKVEDSESVIEQKSDEKGRYLWVTHTKWTEKPVEKPEPPTPEEEAPEGEEAPAEGEEAPAEGEEALAHAAATALGAHSAAEGTLEAA